ncbi:DNA damage-regulated autophagy modulator protein 1-like isoform X1 [Mytilus galloprovincialis]|uniref:DNA damage-regulated autophagy modulator protein 1-like isoform X1 n=1 Tax=Mytilus galloprovincialis TaxID=29158 RepID=UPI003F7C07E1
MLFAASCSFCSLIYLLPIVTNVWIWISFGTTYGLAFAQNHTNQDFPYISYTGVDEPESGIFSFLITVSAIMLAVNAEIRFLFIRERIQRNRANCSNRWQIANIIGLVVGILSSIGLLMVACFQVDTMFPPHIVGAAVAFILPLIYMFLQTALTRKLKRARWEWLWQCINSVVTCIIFVIFIVPFVYIKVEKKEDFKDVLLLAKITELLLALSLYAFLISFMGCFKEIRVLTINVQLVEDNHWYQDEENRQQQVPLTLLKDTQTI